MWKSAGLAVLALLLLAAPGCVERKMLIRSDPPGALVTLNRDRVLEERTPAEVPFDHYGDYAVKLELEGHETLEGSAPMDAPWWAWPPFDLITDLLLPFTIHDRREYDFKLASEPELIPLEELREGRAALLERAEDLRRKVNEGDPAEAE